ncbi:hypothetical protein BFW86_16565 [Pseudomonas fluorescens]|nr:hypothetical protein BFW86_16565 [Pseudomonas fluorescens]
MKTPQERSLCGASIGKNIVGWGKFNRVWEGGDKRSMGIARRGLFAVALARLLLWLWLWLWLPL